jgi:hypothetical protein
MNPNDTFTNPTGFLCRVETAKVARVVKVDGLFRQEYTALRFERTIHWFRSFTCRAMVINSRGSVIETLSTYCSYDSFDAMLSESIAEARHAQGEYDGMAVRVGVVVCETPLLVVPEYVTGQIPSWRRSGPRYHRVPGDWARDDERIDRWVKACEETSTDDSGLYNDENHLRMITETYWETLGWRSDWTEEENADARLALLKFTKTGDAQEAVG